MSNRLPYVPEMFRDLVSEASRQARQRGDAYLRRYLKDSLAMNRSERKVIGLILDGLDSGQIAGRLGITVFAVKSHVGNVMDKLALRLCF